MKNISILLLLLSMVLLSPFGVNAQSISMQVLGPSSNAHFGGSGSGYNEFNKSTPLAADDFNGDGIQDLAIGAPDAAVFTPGFRDQAGSVYIIFGRPGRASVIDSANGTDVRILGAAAGDHTGWALASGDVNGDGVADLVIGAPDAAVPGRDRAGVVFVVLGSRAFGSSLTLDLAQPNVADVSIYGPPSQDGRFGMSLAVGAAGGSSAEDLLVGAPGGRLGAGAGAAFLLFGQSGFGGSTRVVDLASASADVILVGTDQQRLGTSVVIADLNGDGGGDIFAGAPDANRPFRSDLGGPSVTAGFATGGVFGLFGPFGSGLVVNLAASPQAFSFYGGGPGDQFGMALAAGDLSGEGIADLVIGAPGYVGSDGFAQKAGAVYVLAGNASRGPRRLDIAAHEQSLSLVGGVPANYLGWSVAVGSWNVADNADRTADLLIGAPGTLDNAGFVAIFFGGSGLFRTPDRDLSLPSGVANIALFGPPQSAGLGFALAGADLDGDGSGDLVVAQPFSSLNGRAQAGQVEVQFGTVKPVVPDPVRVTTNSLPSATRGALYSQQLSAAGGTGPYYWLVTDGSLPGGLMLDANTGVISGAPAASGAFSFTVAVRDAAFASAARSLQIAVIEPVPVPHITDVSYKTKKGKLTVSGENFDNAAVLRIDGEAVGKAKVDGGVISAKKVRLASGAHHLIVENPNGVASDPFSLIVP
jgi:hypothetical protein